MRAVVFDEPGGPEALRTAELPDPRPADGQVRVRVKFAGVQPYDYAVRQGWVPHGVSVTPPCVLGNEFSGVVDEVGPGATGFPVGTEVVGFAVLACYAEYVAVSTDQIVRKPATMTLEEGGGLSGCGQAAHTALEVLGVRKGETVLVHAAAGGVGTIAVQLAVDVGATVIGTASERNHDYLRSLGAVPVTYGDGLVDRVRELAPRGVDAAVDGAGEQALRQSLDLVADRSRVGTLVAFGLIEELGVRPLISQRSAARLAALTELNVRGGLALHVRSSYPLAEAAKAHAEVETGHGRGKVVLSID